MFYEDKRLEIREVIRKLCEWKRAEIIKGEICLNHIHLLWQCCKGIDNKELR